VLLLRGIELGVGIVVPLGIWWLLVGVRRVGGSMVVDSDVCKCLWFED